MSKNINLNSWNYNKHPLFKDIEVEEELQSMREAKMNVVYVCKTSVILVLQRYTLIVAVSSPIGDETYASTMAGGENTPSCVGFLTSL